MTESFQDKHSAAHARAITVFETLGEDVVIGVGVQKAGTSSIAKYLQANGLKFNSGKELHAFNAMQPLVKQDYLEKLRYSSRGGLYGEYTPNYLDHPSAIWNLSQILPKAKIIVSLRDPIDRAFSAYVHAVGIGVIDQSASFEEIVNESKMGFHGKWVKSLLRMGEYNNQLLRLFAHFPKEQITVINFSELVQQEKQGQVLSNLLEWLGVEMVHKEFRKVNDASWASRKRSAKSKFAESSTREYLKDYYRDSVKKTEEILGKKLDWGFD